MQVFFKFASPILIFAGFISLLMFVEFVLAFLYFKTAEAYSVWCWLGLTVHLWAVSYPFVYPKLLSKKIE
jgi:hypothetical protein